MSFPEFQFSKNLWCYIKGSNLKQTQNFIFLEDSWRLSTIKCTTEMDGTFSFNPNLSKTFPNAQNIKIKIISTRMLSFFPASDDHWWGEGGWNSSRKGGSGRSSEAYRHKNSDEKRRRLLKLRNWTPSLTLDHRDPHQIDPNVPVFLENVVFFEIERRGGFSELDCVHTAARAAAHFSWTPSQDNSSAKERFHEISRRYHYQYWYWQYIFEKLKIFILILTRYCQKFWTWFREISIEECYCCCHCQSYC